MIQNLASEIFLDTSYAIALSAPRDEFHLPALHLADIMEGSRTRLITTRAVLLEIGNALSKQKYRSKAVHLLSAIEADADIDIVPISDDLYLRAFKLFEERPDKEWGLIDCASYVVMQERGVNQVLTTDEHFAQMGFRVLLREPS